MRLEQGFIFGSALFSGGVPDDIKTGLVQVITALVSWGLVELLKVIKLKKK